MRKRLAVVTAGLLLGLMAGGTANALVLDTAPGPETVGSVAAVAGTETVYEVGDAGTVTITNDGTQLEIVSVDQNLSLIHISEPTRHICLSRMPSSA